jgi:membrane-bound serine protease (ClpP class)
MGWASLASGQGAGTVGLCEMTGTVNSGIAAYLGDCVRLSESRGYEALAIRVDTPGGALESTRDIVRDMLGADVPVLVWIGPAGARAGSAGVFITLASHLAAMAPGTNIGAAHPVMGPTGEDPEKGGSHMAEKVVNDTAAFAEAIAKQRGRNVEWAIRAVRDSESVPADRAIELGVVEYAAASLEDFLTQVDGKTVSLPSGDRVLHTAGARIEPIRPSVSQSFVHWLANPAIAYILFVVGGLGLAIELTNPGGIVPGLVGGVCLILAMIAFSSLPVQAGAVILLVLGIGLILAEFFVPSGLLGLAGVGLLVLGGLLLVDRFNPEWFVEPSFAISLGFLLPIAILAGGLAAFAVLRAAQTRSMRQYGGDLGLIGEKGRALSPIGPEGGTVFVHGERWNAKSAVPIPQGANVTVREVEGLTITVEEIS